MGDSLTLSVPKRALRWLAGVACVAVLAAAVLPHLAIYHQEPLGIWTTTFDATSVESREKWATRLDWLADQLPAKPMLTSIEEMNEWAIEILPYMAYEGIHEPEANIPYDLGLFFAMSASAFHLAGQAMCRTLDEGEVLGPIILNGRYINPVSTWYGRETSLAVLTHELVHMQGGTFCSGKSEDLEANTQIAAMEVMAAMVNHGNKAVLRPLLLELKDMVLASLQYDLDRAAYMSFRVTLDSDPFTIAAAEKSYRHWGTASTELKDILYKYNVVPVNAIIEGLGDGTVERVQSVQWNLADDTVEVLPLQVDDLQYLFAHVDDYVRSATE